MKNVTPFKKEKDVLTAGLPDPFITARVLEKREALYLLRTGDGVLKQGRKADGCLLQPEINDFVLIWEDKEEGAFILNVLIKEGTRSHLVFKGETALQTTSGTLKIEGEAVEVKASKTAAVCAPEVNLSGMTGKVRFISFSFICSAAFAHMERISIAIEKCNSVIGRLTQRIKDSFRRVERIDQTRAGMIRQIAEERFSVKADHAAILAENDVKIDGEKIHIG